MKASNWKRMLSGLMAVLMVLSNMPVMAFASAEDGLCAHHESHVECGYQEAVEGSECTHVCDESCYQTVTICVHEHGDCGYAAAVAGVPCDHVHGDCGYAEAVPGVPCDHVHGDCGYAEAVPGVPCDHVHGDCGYAEVVPGTPCDHVCGEACAEGCVHTCGDGTCSYAEGTEGSDCTHVCGDGTCAYAEASEGSDCTHVCTDGTCAYAEGTEGSDCAHVCGDGACAYSEGSEEVPCGHECTAESGCVTTILNCQHTHDETCGYVESVEAKPCDYVCKVCHVQGMIDALPGTVTMDNASDVESALAEIDAFCTTLSDDELAQVDMTKFDAAAQALSGLAAAPAAEDNSCGDNLTWSYDADTTTLTISGSGWMYDYHEVTAPWAGVAGEVTSIVIEDGVHGIGNHAFQNFSKLKTVSFGRDVSWIASAVFLNCTSLEEIALPDGLEAVQGGMFHGCTSLKSVHLPDNARDIYGNAFMDCTSLTSITIPSKVTAIHPGAFVGCSKLETVVLPEGLTYIGDAFGQCTSLKNINIPSTVRQFEGLAFWNCTSLEEIQLPEGLTKLPDGLFNGCTSLSSVNIPSTVTEIGGHVFLFCNELKSVTIPGGVTTIGEGAFNQMGIESIVIPDSVTTLGDSLFFGCPNLASVTLGTGLTGIPANAFTGCEKLTEITIPGNVKAIGPGAFADTGLTSLTLEEGITTIDDDVFAGVPLTEVTIPASVTRLGGAAFADSGLEKITFLGDAPEIAFDTFANVTAEVVIPEDNDTWTDEVKQDYSGNLTWPGEGPVTSGDCGDSLTWSYDEETTTLTISGTGTMYDGKAWDAFAESITKVVIESGVTSIGEGSFAEMNAMTEISIPATVQEIGPGAFSNSKALTSVVLPEGLTALPESLFNGCEMLASVNIPGTVTTIGDYAFLYCYALKNVTIPSSVTTIGVRSFAQNGLTSLVIPDSVTSAGDGLCFDCKDITSVTLGTGLKELKANDFTGCESLQSLTIPGNIQTIGQEALATSGLTSVTLEEGITTIGTLAFASSAGLTKVTIPASVKEIGDRAFLFTGLTEITFLGNAPTIGANNFYNATVTACYPAGDDSWTDEVMQNYGGTVTWVPAYAIGGSCGDNLRWGYDSESGTLHIFGSGWMYDYHEVTAPWASYAEEITSVVIDNGVRGIGNAAFRGCTKLTDVSFGRDVSWIGDGAFDGCTALQSVTLPDGLQEIRSFMFAGCTSLKTVILPENATSLGMGAFTRCSALTAVNIPAGITVLNGGTFDGCSSLESIALPEGLISIGEAAFANCAALTDISIPSGVTEIGELTFWGCSSLTEIVLPEGLTKVPASIFNGCTNLSSVTIPSTVIEIGSHAFLFCNNLKSITLPAGVTTIGEAAFNQMGIESVVIPNSVTTMGESQFFGCQNLKSVTIGTGLTEIPANAFTLCENLTEITVPANVKTIGAAVFADTGLEKIVFEGNAPTIAEDAFGGVTATAFYPNGNDTWKEEVLQNYGGNITWHETVPVIVWGTDPSPRAFALSGGTVRVYAYVNGENLKFQWYRAEAGSDEFKPVSGATAPVYTEVMTAENDQVQVYCEVTNDFNGRDVSETVTLCLLTETASGQCGANAYWELDASTGKLTVTGTGAMYDYTNNVTDTPWAEYVYAVKSIAVSEGITHIGSRAFQLCAYATSVSLPDSLTSMGEYAFAGCESLTSFPIPAGLSVIPVGMLERCSGIRTLVIPDTVTEIQKNAFFVSGIRSITLPSGLTAIPEGMLYYCQDLTEITIPASVTSIGEGAMALCFNLKKISFEGGAPSIVENAFQNVTATVSYPAEDTSWTDEVRQNYGGNLTWNGKYDLKIIRQPESVAAANGATAKVTFEAQGDGLTYTWYFKDTAHTKFYKTTSFTGPSYQIQMNSTRAGRQVYCVVTDKYGSSVTTDTVTLNMASGVKIVQQPVSTEEEEGVNAIVTVRAEGDGLTYQWYFKDTTHTKFYLTTSFKGASYTVQMNESRNGRQVYCVITDQYGNTVTTDTVTLTMSVPKTELKITKQPVSVTVVSGATAKVTLTAQGDGLTYAWYFKNAGAKTFSLTTSFTGNSYSVKMDASRDGRQIYCIVTDQYGDSVQSNTVTLNMATALKITQQPKSVEGAEGEKVITSVRAQGDGLTYSWYYKDKGATKFTYTKSFKGASYSVEMNEARDGRQVYCIITDQYGNTVTTDIATLTMSAPKTELKITKQPVSVTAASGTTVKITLTAQGDGLTYKWYFKNAGAKNFSLTTSFTGNSYSVKMDASRDGRQVYCVVTDQYGDSVQSNTVTLTMAASLKITQQPKSVEAAAGVKAITTVKAEGDGLTYSWYFKDKGAADFSYTKSFRGASYSVEMNEARDGRQVYCVITDQYGNTVTTDIATLTMSTAGTELKITKQPVSVSVAEGTTAKVTFTAQGDGLTYKWYFKNANASTFSLTTTFTGNSYSAKMDASRNGRQVYCVVTDQYGNTVITDTVTISMS